MNNYFYLQAVDKDAVIRLYNNNRTPDIKYSKNGKDWTKWEYKIINNQNEYPNLTIDKNTKMYFKGNNGTTFNLYLSGALRYCIFSEVSGGKALAGGNIMSLLDDGACTGTEVGNYCFYGLFSGFERLDIDDSFILPATTLGLSCYECMFAGCNLTKAPELPATTLAGYCYSKMFENCPRLTTAPELPATTLAGHCYYSMFSICTSLTKAPELNATTLEPDCYNMMFERCISLTKAPKLPATTLKEGCYYEMFYGCISLNSITCLAEDISATDCTYRWLNNVSSTGTFTKSENMSDWTIGTISGIPVGWNVEDFGFTHNGLTFTAIENSTISLSNVGGNKPDIWYSIDLKSWTKWDYSSIELAKGRKIYFKGSNGTSFSKSTSQYSQFVMTGKISASGNIMSLLYGDDYEGQVSLSGKDYCFINLFKNCSSLVTSPELPAKTLAPYCYRWMFNNCTNLTTAPELPSTTLSKGCYHTMFQNCSNLVNAPVLPATTLADQCYQGMFSLCISLKNAPVLPAKTLNPQCYQNMFNGCSKLNYIKCLLENIQTELSVATTDWVNGVAETGTFVKADNADFWQEGANGIPTGWNVKNASEYKVFDVLYVSGRYNFKIPKGDGTYYVIDTKNDCEADVITKTDFTSLNEMIIGSKSVADEYEWEIFFARTNLYFDLSYNNNRRLSWNFGTVTKDTVYTIGGSNGNYLGTDRALYVNGSKKVSSTTKSTYNNTSDIVFFGENRTDVHIGNIKIYEKTGLVYNIVPIMINGKVAFYDKVNKRFMEITATPPSQSVTTRTTGEKIIVDEVYNITVTSNDNEHCSVFGNGQYIYGEKATIKCVPLQGYEFVQWNDGNTDATREVTVTSDATFTATIRKLPTVTLNGDNCTLIGAGTYSYGANVEISCVPNDLYEFVRWSDGNTNATRIITVTEDITLTAVTRAITSQILQIKVRKGTDEFVRTVIWYLDYKGGTFSWDAKVETDYDNLTTNVEISDDRVTNISKGSSWIGDGRIYSFDMTVPRNDSDTNKEFTINITSTNRILSDSITIRVIQKPKLPVLIEDIFVSSGDVENALVTIPDTMGEVLVVYEDETLARYTIDDCVSNYVLYYRNALGGIDLFPVTGKVIKSNNIEHLTINKKYDNRTLNFGKTNYENILTEKWQLYSGRLTDQQSKLMHHLINSTYVYLYDIQADKFTPVVITDTEMEYKTYKNNNNKMVYYTINVEASQTKYRR